MASWPLPVDSPNRNHVSPSFCLSQKLSSTSVCVELAAAIFLAGRLLERPSRLRPALVFGVAVCYRSGFVLKRYLLVFTPLMKVSSPIFFGFKVKLQIALR